MSSCISCKKVLKEKSSYLTFYDELDSNVSHKIHEECFECFKCKQPLSLDNAIIPHKKNFILCKEDYYKMKSNSHCNLCGDICLEGIEENGSIYHQQCYHQAQEQTVIDFQSDEITKQLEIDAFVDELVFGSIKDDAVVLKNIPAEGPSTEQLFASTAEHTLDQEAFEFHKSDYEMDMTASPITDEPNFVTVDIAEFSAEQNGFINPPVQHQTEFNFNPQYSPYQNSYTQFQNDVKPFLRQSEVLYNPYSEVEYITPEQYQQLVLQQQGFYSAQQNQSVVWPNTVLPHGYNNSYVFPEVKPQVYQIADISQGQILCDVTDQISATQQKENSSNKRARLTISEQHKNILMAAYQKKHFPSAKERRTLGDLTGMSARRVQIWFQNMRSKDKKLNGIPVKKRQPKANTFPLEDDHDFSV